MIHFPTNSCKLQKKTRDFENLVSEIEDSQVKNTFISFGLSVDLVEYRSFDLIICRQKCIFERLRAEKSVISSTSFELQPFLFFFYISDLSTYLIRCVSRDANKFGICRKQRPE